MMQESRLTSLQRKQINQCLKSKSETFGWEVGGCSMVISTVLYTYIKYRYFIYYYEYFHVIKCVFIAKLSV